MNVTLTLTDDQLEQLAERVADVLERRSGADTKHHNGSEWVRGAQAAAEYLGCPRSRIYDLVSQAQLEPHRDGRVLCFRRAELDGYLNGENAR